MTAVGSRKKTVDVRSDLQASSCGTWPFAVSTSGTIDDRRSYMYMQSGVRKALFLTLSKAVEQGMIGEDKHSFREGLREVEGH